MMQYGLSRSAWVTIHDRRSASAPGRRCSGERATGRLRPADRLVRPVINDEIYGYEKVNVAAQRRDPESLLNWTERRIRMRKECPDLGWGDYTVLRVDVPEVLAIRYDFRGVSMLTLHNFSSRRQSFAVDPRTDNRRLWSMCSTRTTAGPRAACTRSRFRPTVIAGTGWALRTTRSIERASSRVLLDSCQAHHEIRRCQTRPRHITGRPASRAVTPDLRGCAARDVCHEQRRRKTGALEPHEEGLIDHEVRRRRRPREHKIHGDHGLSAGAIGPFILRLDCCSAVLICTSRASAARVTRPTATSKG